MSASVTRTFVAIELPEPIRLAVARLQETLQGEVTGLRWTDPSQLHLTLAFLGDVPNSALDPLGDLIEKAVAPLSPIAMALEGLGAFPTLSNARVLWIGVDPDSHPMLGSLHQAVVRATQDSGYPPTDSRFHPHITIARARARQGPGLSLGMLLERYATTTVGSLVVQEVATFASVLSPSGPAYSVLRSARLAGPSP